MNTQEAFHNFGVDFSISWMPSWDCNLSCEYCGAINVYRGLMAGPEGGSLNGEFREKTSSVHWSEWTRAFNALPGRAHIDISGGEPFMYSDFVDVITNIDKRHLLAITTNLTLPIDRIMERIPPERITCITASLHMDYPRWRTTFFKRLLTLWKKGYTVQCNFVAYPDRLKYLPLLHKVFCGRPELRIDYWVRGKALPPVTRWTKSCSTVSGANFPYYTYSYASWLPSFLKSPWNKIFSDEQGRVYKNGQEIPHAKVPEYSSTPAAKVHGASVFINEAAFDEDATYTVDYPVGIFKIEEWRSHRRESGWTEEMIRLNEEAQTAITLCVEPYSGGAVVPFEGYTEEEHALIDRYCKDLATSVKVRKEIRNKESSLIEKPLQKRCNAGQHRFMIAPNGNVYPCNMIYMKRRELCMGNFLQIYRTLDERILCDLPCTCGGDREHVIIEYQE